MLTDVRRVHKRVHAFDAQAATIDEFTDLVERLQKDLARVDEAIFAQWFDATRRVSKLSPAIR